MLNFKDLQEVEVGGLMHHKKCFTSQFVLFTIELLVDNSEDDGRIQSVAINRFNAEVLDRSAVLGSVEVDIMFAAEQPAELSQCRASSFGKIWN